MGFHEHGNVILGFIKVGEILCQPELSVSQGLPVLGQCGGVGEGNPAGRGSVWGLKQGLSS